MTSPRLSSGVGPSQTSPWQRAFGAGPGVGWTLAVALAVNVVLLIAYLWSRGGQTITVRVEARGNEVAAFVDGREFARADIASASGGPVILLSESGEVRLPSLPRPHGVRAVEVTNVTTQELLFRWRFGDSLPETATLIPAIDLSGQPWVDYAVEVTLRNPTSAGLAVRARGSNGPIFGFDRYSTPAMFLRYVDAAGETQTIGTDRLEFGHAEGVRGLLGMALAPYPLALLLLVACLGVGMAASMWPPKKTARFSYLSDYTAYAAWMCALAAFFICAVLMTRYGQRMPHIVDETSYIYQARLLASGRTHLTTPVIPEAFQFAESSFIIDYEGRWASFYPFGHPLVLSLGELAGAGWIVPPLVGAAGVFLMFLLGSRLFGPFEGLLAALLMTTSPFFLMQSSTFMSHSTAVMYLLAALTALLAGPQRGHPALWGAAAGLAFGLLFNTRPYTCVVLAPWFTLLLVAPLIRGGTRRLGASRAVGFVAGALVMLAAYYLYNHATTGTWSNGYQESGDLGAALGFDGPHSLSLGLDNQQAMLATLLLVMNGWPTYMGLLFVLLPFMLGTRRLIDWWMAGASVTVMGAMILYKSSGIAYGPRYWYEIVPLLLLLTARGVALVPIRVGEIARAMPRTLSRSDSAESAGRLLVTLMVLALVGASLYSWLFAQQPSWRFFATPSRPAELRMDFDDRLVRKIRAAHIDNGLVLVQSCGKARLCFQSVFLLNSPDLRGRIVVANDLGSRNPDLFALYPCRDLYYATYEPPAIKPAGKTPGCD